MRGILAAFPVNKNQTFCFMQRSSFSQKESIKRRKEAEFFPRNKELNFHRIISLLLDESHFYSSAAAYIVK
jgi:hypothetical protein